jgi:hypothetical protein
MNLFRAAMHLVSFYTSLIHVGAFMLVKDLLGIGFDAAMVDDEAK